MECFTHLPNENSARLHNQLNLTEQQHREPGSCIVRGITVWVLKSLELFFRNFNSTLPVRSVKTTRECNNILNRSRDVCQRSRRKMLIYLSSIHILTPKRYGALRYNKGFLFQKPGLLDRAKTTMSPKNLEYKCVTCNLYTTHSRLSILQDRDHDNLSKELYYPYYSTSLALLE